MKTLLNSPSLEYAGSRPNRRPSRSTKNPHPRTQSDESMSKSAHTTLLFLVCSLTGVSGF